MDCNNLIEFNSPSLPIKLHVKGESRKRSISPGNNPFDTLSKYTESVQIPETEFTTGNVFDFTSTNLPISGRESLALLNDFADCGRESLGILKLEALNSSLSTDNGSNTGSPFNTGFLCSTTGGFDSAFLHPYNFQNRKQSTLSSCSSASINPSFFNSGSLEASEPSKIYSLSSSRFNRIFSFPSDSEENLNNAFITSNNPCKVPNVTCDDFTSTENKHRLLSLPDLSKKDELKVCIGEEKLSCRSESEIAALEKRLEICDSNIQEEEEESGEFNNSVFIEANYWASKFADGSIVLESSTDGNILDNTSPPDFEDIENVEREEKKPDTKTVFKCIDKMLPCIPQDCQKELEPKTEKQAELNSDRNKPEPEQNLTNTVKNKNISTTSNGSSTTNSKNAKEILQNLSEIINSEHRDSKESVLEGQKLLNSLADILCPASSTRDSLDDSGHSSIETTEEQWNDPEQHNCYEILDLRVASKSNEEEEQALDLSIKPNSNSNKRLSQSFSFRLPKLPPAKSLYVRTVSASSITSNVEPNRGKAGSDPVKVKQKKVGVIKKGPLKAIIPLGNMSKRASLTGDSSGSFTNGTPPKTSRRSSLFKVNRTSTPITEPKLKPVAQSTPDNIPSGDLERSKPISCSSQLKKRKFYCPVSPLVKTNSIGSDTSCKTNRSTSRSGSTPNLSNQSTNSKTGDASIKNMSRRHSAGELKSIENALNPTRRFSTGRDVKIASSVVSRVKQNISAVLSPRKSLLKGADQSKGALQEKNAGGGALSKIKPVNMLSKLKKNSLGKENLSR